jgi:hypothetical protein
MKLGSLIEGTYCGVPFRGIIVGAGCDGMTVDFLEPIRLDLLSGEHVRTSCFLGKHDPKPRVISSPALDWEDCGGDATYGWFLRATGKQKALESAWAA